MTKIFLATITYLSSFIILTAASFASDKGRSLWEDLEHEISLHKTQADQIIKAKHPDTDMHKIANIIPRAARYSQILFSRLLKDKYFSDGYDNFLLVYLLGYGSYSPLAPEDSVAIIGIRGSDCRFEIYDELGGDYTETYSKSDCEAAINSSAAFRDQLTPTNYLQFEDFAPLSACIIGYKLSGDGTTQRGILNATHSKNCIHLHKAKSIGDFLELISEVKR